MNPRDLVPAVLSYNDLAARQLVKDAKREGFAWAQAPAPLSSEPPREQAVYAGLVEMLSAREGQAPPAWTGRVGPSPEPVYLVTSPKWQLRCKEQSPGPLKSRNVFAPREYLDVL